ncbi:MAG: flavin reductase, partial [Chloroflexi bacterium]|nr:flavin reductase [Chloroflexota bacterium]
MTSQLGVSRPLQIDRSGLRQAMGRFATGVTVVTTRLGEELHGMTANAVTSVSLQPLLALVCVDKAAHLHGAMSRSGIFGLSVLSREQEALARRFSNDARAHDTSDFDGVRVFEAATGAPLIEGCLSYVD